VTDYTHSDPHQGAWLVYLNGIEVPCPSVSISYGVWTIPEATLSFAPHRLLQRLGNEDRIEVVVFYLDTLADPDDPTWKLCFEGEIVGWSYTNSPSGRQMSFNALADVAIWTQLYYFFMNTVDAVTEAVVHNAGVNGITQAGVFYPFSLFKKGLIVKPNNEAEDIERPFELVYNVVRGMLDKGIPEQQRTLPAVNFFARWARKRNFVNRFAALPVFEDEGTPAVFPILEAVQATSALDSSRGDSAASIGNAGTLFQVIQELLSRFYFELAMIPTAPCFRVRLGDGTILGPAQTSPSEPSQIAKEPLRVVNYFAKPQMLFGVPPTCNVIFPSMMTSLSYAESYLAQPTRTYVNDQLVGGVLQHTLGAAALTAAWPPSASVIMRHNDGAESSKAAATPTVTNKNMLVHPEELYKGPILSRSAVPSWFTYLMSRTGAGSSEGPLTEDVQKQEVGRIQKLFNLYVQYEHYRQRYEKRGGAVNMAFNPYILPGFPCMIFDQRASAMDTVGYVTQVTQSFSTNGMRTAIQYSFGRTFQEMLGQLRSDVLRTNEFLASAPADPIPQIRKISQDFEKAEEFYTSLLFGRHIQANKHAAFDFRRVVGYVKPDEAHWYDDERIEPIAYTTAGLSSNPNMAAYNNAVNAAALADTAFAHTSELYEKACAAKAAYDEAYTVYDNHLQHAVKTAEQATALNHVHDAFLAAQAEWDKYAADFKIIEDEYKASQGYAVTAQATVAKILAGMSDADAQAWSAQLAKAAEALNDSFDIEALPGAKDLFENYDAAMAYVSRPICTLQEYVSFIHGGATLAELEEGGQLEGLNNSYAYDTTDVCSGATYYTRIKRLRPGPGTDLAGAQSGVSEDASGEPIPYTGVLEGLDSEYPQTRIDWDVALLAYREAIIKDTPKR